MDALGDITILIAAAVAAVALLRRLRLPPIIAYVAVGGLLGPHALGAIDDSHAMEVLGEIGIAFLLFTIGLEFSLPRFFELRGVLLGLGGAQVLIGTVAGALIALGFGTPLPAALVVGGALAMSSTAIVVKQLTDQGELLARHGQLALGILLFQDLAAVPFLVAIPLLADSTGGVAAALGTALLEGLAAVVVMLALGRYALRPLFYEVASARSRELFTLCVLLVSLCAAWLTSALGLSLALGTFVAGMMLSETEYRHQIETELRPFKDVLLGLFFVTVGMRIDAVSVLQNWPWVLLLVVGLVLGKGGAIAALAWAWRRDGRVALRTGLVLGHGGEFGFALLALALGTKLLDATDAQPILAAVVVSMVLAPVLVRHNSAITARLLPGPLVPSSTAAEIAAATSTIGGHVVIAGYGRVGSQVGALLRADQVPFVAIDRHPERARAGWESGLPVFYGDTTHRDVLAALGLARARALVVSFDDDAAALWLVKLARALNPTVPILVRTRDDHHLEALLAAGADEVVPEAVETGLMLSLGLLTRLGYSDVEVEARLRAARESRYQVLRELVSGGGDD